MAYPYHDLREFMEACDKAGEMVTIDREVDWNLEAGAIARRITEIGAPMAFMPKVRGCNEGFSILASPISKGWRGDFSRVAIALGMDPGDPDIIKEKPRSPKESLFAHGGIPFIILNGLVKGGLALAAFWMGLAWGGGVDSGLPLARTMAFCVLSLTQLFHAFNTRHITKSLLSVGPFKNRWLIGAFFLCSFIQVVVVLVPGFAAFFKVIGLSAAQWGVVWLLSFSTIFFNELAKLLVRTVMKAKKKTGAVQA